MNASGRARDDPVAHDGARMHPAAPVDEMPMVTSEHADPGHDHHAANTRASYRSGFLFGTAVGVLSTIFPSRLYGVRIIGGFALVSAPVGVLWILSSVKEQQAL